jgi:hypothetical protein
MSCPRLASLPALGLLLVTGACGAPLAVTAVSYGADGVSLVDSGKSTTDHFASMVSKKDCALWRVLRNQSVCRPRADGRDPYKVDYDQPNRQISEDGVAYAPPLHAKPDAPAMSWTAEAYKPAPVEATPTPAPVEGTPFMAEATPTSPAAVTPKASPHRPAKKKAKAHAHAHAKPVKKALPNQVASAL